MDTLQQTQSAAGCGRFHVCFDHNSSCHSHKASTLFSSLNHQRLRCRALFFHWRAPSRPKIAEERRAALSATSTFCWWTGDNLGDRDRQSRAGGIDKSCRGSERMFQFMFQNSFIPGFKFAYIPGKWCGAPLWFLLHAFLRAATAGFIGRK